VFIFLDKPRKQSVFSATIWINRFVFFIHSSTRQAQISHQCLGKAKISNHGSLTNTMIPPRHGLPVLLSSSILPFSSAVKDDEMFGLPLEQETSAPTTGKSDKQAKGTVSPLGYTRGVRDATDGLT
jgi:hypothetical protein